MTDENTEVPMGEANQAFTIPLVLPPMPLPTATVIHPDQANHAVVMEIHTPSGVQIVFFDVDTANRVSQDLATAAHAAKGSKLSLPPQAGRLVLPG